MVGVPDGIRPALRPTGPQQHRALFWDAAVLPLPRAQILCGRLILRHLENLLRDIHDHGRHQKLPEGNLRHRAFALPGRSRRMQPGLEIPLGRATPGVVLSVPLARRFRPRLLGASSGCCSAGWVRSTIADFPSIARSRAPASTELTGKGSSATATS